MPSSISTTKAARCSPTSRSRAARASIATRWPHRPSSASSSKTRSCARAASTTNEQRRSRPFTVTDFFDALETRDPGVREATLLAALTAQIANALAHAPAYAERFAGVDAASIASRAALATLPVLHKHELFAQQKASAGDAFGGFAAIGWGREREASRRASRVFASPGPIHEPDSSRSDYWRM